MKVVLQNILTLAVLMFLFFGTSSVLYGQSNPDSIKLKNGLNGNNYTEFDEDKKEGEFEFYTAEKDSTDEDFTIGHVYKGTFKDGKKDGAWEYSYNRLRPTRVSKIQDLSIKYNGSGNQFFVQAQFDENSAVGSWKSFYKNIEDGKITDTLFRAQTKFVKNKMAEVFEASSDSMTIQGEINESGFLSGTWSFYQTTKENGVIEEQRVYDEGVLIEHKLIIDEEEYAVKHIGLDQTEGGEGESWKEVNVSESYFNIIYQTNFGVEDALSLDKSNQLIKRSNQFLKKSIFSFGKYNETKLWTVLNEDDILYPKLRVRSFPYTDKEKENIEKGSELIEKSNALIKEYLEDPQVDINRYNYKEVSLYYEIYKIYKKELTKLKNVFDKLSLPVYEYIDRSEILPHIIEDGINYPEKVEFEYEDKKQEEEYSFPEDISKNDFSIQMLVEHLEVILKSIEETKEEVTPIIEKNKKRAEIADKETELVEIRDSILTLFNDKENREDYNKYHESFKEDIIKFTLDKFKDYANKDVEDRLGKTQSVIDCFKMMASFYSDLVDLKEKVERIEESYTREVWSPVVYTYMTETIKERIYKAYENILLEKVIEDIKSNIDCDKMQEKVENISILYKEMMSIRDRDTSKEERSLRRVKDADKILSILNIKLN